MTITEHTANLEEIKRLIPHRYPFLLIDKVENIKNKVPYGDRSNSIIEPYLTEQWFVDAKRLSHDAKKIVTNICIYCNSNIIFIIIFSLINNF